MDKFFRDLEAAKVLENTVADIFWTTPCNTKEKEYDMIAYIECKDDIASLKRWNVALEYKYDGKPSGICQWDGCICYKAFNSLYLCSKVKLREWIDKNPDKYRDTLWWDWNKSSLYIVAKRHFVTIFHELIPPK